VCVQYTRDEGKGRSEERVLLLRVWLWE